MIAILADFHFLRPGFLLLVPLVLLAWWAWQRSSDPLRGWRSQMDPELLKALVSESGPAGLRSGWAWLAGCLVAVLAIAGPAWRPAENPLAEDEPALMILLKADESMELADPAPSRMERARLKIADLAAARSGLPTGLIAYSGSAHLVLPPTRDTAAVADMAAEISPEIMPLKGDRLDLALSKAGRLLGNLPQGGSILVLADSVAADRDTLRESNRDSGNFPVQFLSFSGTDSAARETLQAASGALDGSLLDLSSDDTDIAAITRAMDHLPVTMGSEAGGGWQDGGWYLVAVPALLIALSFRRISSGREAAK